MKPWPAPGRVACEVPGCRRTFKADFDGVRVICGKHARLAPRWMRRRKIKLLKLAKKLPEGSVAQDRAYDLSSVMWERIRARAIEVSMGISA